jgi:SAM-dependent methyltransferase
MDSEQVTLWNDVVGDAWVEHADDYDVTLQPFGDAVLERLALATGDRVLDIGCGTGATTLAIGTRVAPGRVLGVDISATMLAAARRRVAAAGCANVEFVQRDVQESAGAAGEFDAAFSRMGVMFFPDPVLAFTRVNEALVDGGRLGFACFQSPMSNPFLVVPVMTASMHLGVGGPPDLDKPGPFSFADPAKVTRVLHEAGFVDVVIEPGPDQGDLGEVGDQQALTSLARRLVEQNPGVAPTFAAASATTQDATVAAVAEALRPHLVDGRIVMGASTWVVTARATGVRPNAH